jgi:polar amino acid transport system substrate-binding protein
VARRLLRGRGRSCTIAFCIVLVFVALSRVRPATADEAQPLRLCVDPDNLPFSSENPATPGFYVELGRDIAQALGRPFQPVWVPTYYTKRQIRKKMLPGQCDGFVGVPEDASFMGPRLILSRPIVHLGYALVALPSTAVDSLQDLHGRRVAVQYDSPPQNLLAGENDVRMVTVLSPDEAMQDLAAGKADVAFIWGASAGWLNKTVMHGAYEVQPVNGDHMQWDATIAFPRDQKDLRDQVDRAIGGLGDSIDRLAAKYGFPAATPTPAPQSAAGSPALIHGDTTNGTPTPQPTLAAQPTAPHPVAPQPAAAATPAEPGISTTPEAIAAGRKLFNDNCSHCHGPDAVQGEQRRNLRLLRQRYGNDMAQMFMTTVTHGRVTKGMPNWSGIISPAEFHKILAFLSSIQEPGS